MYYKKVGRNYLLAMSTKEAKSKRITIKFSPETSEILQRLADETGLSLSQIVRQAIQTEDYLRNEMKEGNKILVHKKSDESFRELVFR